MNKIVVYRHEGARLRFFFREILLTEQRNKSNPDTLIRDVLIP